MSDKYGQVDLRTHRLSDVEYLESPNQNERPDSEISLLVIHCISLPPGEFGSGCVESFFLNQLDHDAHPYFEGLKGVEVSSHLFIRRDGSVVQFVPFDRRAWHAGESCFEGRLQCNDYSIGIELEGTDDTAYSDAQYDALTCVTRALIDAYPQLTAKRITGHEHIAPERKTDPGKLFDWDRYTNLLANLKSDLMV